jgi:voltage-gated potassium channel
MRSQYPSLRAVEALAGAIPLFLVLFASAYLRIAAAQAEACTEPLSKTSALYFIITVCATVGFGTSRRGPRPPALPRWCR